VHRGGVGRFLLAACQVTKAEYALFCRRHRHAPPPFMAKSRSRIPLQPVVAGMFETRRICEGGGAVSGRRFGCEEPEWACAARGGAGQQLYPWGKRAPRTTKAVGARTRAVGSGNVQTPSASTTSASTSTRVRRWYDAGYIRVSDERGPPRPPHRGAPASPAAAPGANRDESQPMRSASSIIPTITTPITVFGSLRR